MGLHRKIYNWTIHWSRTPQATQALAAISFAESSFFPVPPDVLLIAMCIARPSRSFYYALVCTGASVLGGVAGWLIGRVFWEAAGPFFFAYVPGFTEQAFERVAGLYRENAFLTIFTAGFTPIPYKVFTITGGVCGIPLAVLAAASALGRAGRFFLVAALIFFFGEAVRGFIDRYLGWLTVAFTVLLVGGFVLIKRVLH
jgi:membrane protein YqaA with SNARE-associated domain